MTSQRVWLMSFAGAIVMMFIYGALTALGFAIFRGSEMWIIYQPLLLILLFLAIVLYCIKTGKKKKLSGMFLNFGILSLPAIFPLLTALYYNLLDMYGEYRVDENIGEYFYRHPHYEWINDNVMELAFINIGVFFLLLLVAIPLIKKWKSLPEE